MPYTFDEAAALLNMGRNTLTRQLRSLGMIGRDNLPTPRWRGRGTFQVKTGMYEHPVLGYRHYGRTLITESGLNTVARHLGKDRYRPHPGKPATAWLS